MGEDEKYHNSSINIYFVDDGEFVDEEDFGSFRFCIFWVKWALIYWIFVYTSSMVKGGTSAKHIFTSFCAYTTRIWTPARMGYIAYYARTYAASRIKYYGITLVNITW